MKKNTENSVLRRIIFDDKDEIFEAQNNERNFQQNE